LGRERGGEGKGRGREGKGKEKKKGGEGSLPHWRWGIDALASINLTFLLG